jgi:hypothetical protein
MGIGLNLKLQIYFPDLLFTYSSSHFDLFINYVEIKFRALFRLQVFLVINTRQKHKILNKQYCNRQVKVPLAPNMQVIADLLL